jgi:mannose-1-phosphate guanylyltransferase
MMELHPVIEENRFARSAPNAQLHQVLALLLAGGDGTRLQELTRSIAGTPIPKQYCRLWCGSSLLQATFRRAHLFAPLDRIKVVVNQNHLQLARDQLAVFPETSVLVQPLNCDTGPGIVFALLKLASTYPDAIVAAFPTDHFVGDDRAFVAHVLHAVDTVSRFPDKVAILGIAPDRPETGYGYIVPAEPLDSGERTYYVRSFTEKPSLGDAQKIILSGGLWNSFVMVFKLSRMLELVRVTVPHHFENMSQLQRHPSKAPEIYRTLEAWNFSNQVLTKIPQHLITHEVDDVYWSDWGTRESVERTYQALNIVPFWSMVGSASDRIAV